MGVFETDYSDDKYIVVDMTIMKVHPVVYGYADEARNAAMDMARKDGHIYSSMQADGTYRYKESSNQ